jgi:hypothetical protein
MRIEFDVLELVAHREVDASETRCRALSAPRGERAVNAIESRRSDDVLDEQAPASEAAVALKPSSTDRRVVIGLSELEHLLSLGSRRSVVSKD